MAEKVIIEIIETKTIKHLVVAKDSWPEKYQNNKELAKENLISAISVWGFDRVTTHSEVMDIKLEIDGEEVQLKATCTNSHDILKGKTWT